ncbi:MAG: terminase large subunit domain-containing protein [Luteolibacter sp.]
MTASLSSLRTRVKALEAALAKKKARANLYSNEQFTNLPTVGAWPDFAAQTYIRTSGTVAAFDPYEYQRDLIKSINENPNTIVLKSRQTGISETVCSYLLCRALTERGFAAVIFSKTQTDASELGRRVRAMANSIKGENIKFLTDSNIQLAFEGRGTLYFLPATPRAARGIPSCSALFLDEAAFLDGADEIYTAALPTLSMVGEKAKVIVVSTPATEFDFYGRLWYGEEGEWNKVKIHYSQHPVYGADPDWAEKTRKSRRMSLAAWNTEYECIFGQTDATIYPPALVERCSTGQWRECGSIGRDYVLGIDPNGGGTDFFTAMVMDITEEPNEVVAMYRENGRSTEYSLRHVAELVENFQPKRTVIEKNGLGTPIAEALTLNLPSYSIETFNTSRPSKITATDRVLYLMENDKLIFPKGIIAEELKSFRQDETGKREAAPGMNDDTVMALAFACSLIPDEPKLNAFFRNI